MGKWFIKGLKRCPLCKYTNIYRRVRVVKFERNRWRKSNLNLVEERVKRYRCQICKHEFDVPLIE
jgi:hypothetical protein